MNILFAPLLALTLACSAAVAAPPPPPPLPPYQLENTEVRDVRAAALGRDYQLFVALPASYRSSSQRYPIVLVADANYGFPVVRNIAQRLHMHAGMEEAIVVGLSYARGDTPVYSRNRDYTPSVPRKGGGRSDMPGRAPAYGEAAAYGRFITGEVLPLLAASYRADMGRKIFVGHSYGGLLGLQMLFDGPRSFEHYILGSPSLWFDERVMFEREKRHALEQRELTASVYFGIGALENGATEDMVDDLREFDATLKSRRYRGLKTRMDVFPGEDHASVFPFLLTRGLRAYLKKVPGKS